MLHTPWHRNVNFNLVCPFCCHIHLPWRNLIRSVVSEANIKGRGHVIASHIYCGVQFLVPALDTCFWHDASHTSLTQRYGHHDVIIWNTFCITRPLWRNPLRWPAMRTLMFIFMLAWKICWVHNRLASGLRQFNVHATSPWWTESVFNVEELSYPN